MIAKIMWAMFLVLVAFNVVRAEVRGASIAEKIDAQIARAIAENNCPTVDPLDGEGYFIKVFSTEESKVRWLEKIISKARGINNEVAGEAFVSDPEIKLVPEPFIEVVLHSGSSYTFFQSGRISCSFPKRIRLNALLAPRELGVF